MSFVNLVFNKLDNGAKWHKGSYADMDMNCFCLFAATCETDPVEADHGTILEDFQKSILELFPERVPEDFHNASTGTIIKFNDHPDTKWEDVVRVFENTEGFVK